MDDDHEHKGFWSSMPGMLTGIAAVLSAISGLYIAVSSRGPARPADQPPAAAATVALPEKSLGASDRGGSEVPQAANPFVLAAVIDDPDGYTNVRSTRSSSGEIVARVEKGELFYTYPQNGTWWQVRTREGKLGYMHAPRIRIVPAK